MLPVPLPWYYWIGTASFSSGIALLSIGIILQYVEGRHLYYEQHRSGDRIDSGMGGGLILDDTWIHKQLIEFGLETKIREVLSGKLSSLGLSDGEIGRLRGRLLSIEERSKYLDY